MTRSPLPAGLPGAELLEQGLADLARGSTSSRDALLVTAVSHRLGELGLDLPRELEPHPEIALYRLLGETSDDPFTEYRALRSRLDSCIASLELINRSAPT